MIPHLYLAKPIFLMTPPGGPWNLKTVWGLFGRGGGLKRKGVDLLIYIKTQAGYQFYFSFFCMVSKSLDAETIEAQVTWA